MAVVLLGVLACLFIEPAKDYPRGELLIEASELQRLPQRFRIIDTRTRALYQAGHVPGAVWVSHLEWGREFNAAPDAKTWSDRLGRLGIDAGTPVVVYGEGFAPDAALVWWILRYWGIREARLLNGGWKAWQAGGGQATKEGASISPKSVLLTAQEERLATKGQILQWLKTGDKQLIDARSLKEYRGDTVAAERNGAIPTARHLEWSDLIDADSQRLKSAAQMARLFQEQGIRMDRPSVTYCQSGRRAAVMAFALELMGAREVRNYVKSWSEWGNDAATPIEKPSKE